MKKFSVLLLTVSLIFGFAGCGSKAPEKEIDSPASNSAEVDYTEDVLSLVGWDFQHFLDDYYDKEMVLEYREDEGESERYYLLKNGVEISAGEYIDSVRTFYDRKTEYPVPVVKGIGGDHDYDKVVAELGKPYYEGPELTGTGDGKKEFDTAVFYAGHFRYIKIYFDKETKAVSRIACFYDAAPVYEEIDGIKVGDSLDQLKAAYQELYYSPVSYDPSKGEPKYNRLYYTPLADDNRGVECLEFYLYDKKIVRITSNVYDTLEWRNYEDVFGRKNVFKEDNMTGHRGNIVYFYEDESGSEQVLLKIENCATEEIDIDGDGVTEIIAYKAGKMQALDIYDYDEETKTILHLDVCKTLGADWAGYKGNAANVKSEYKNCIDAGFREADGSYRTEVYSVKDNVLTDIGPDSRDMYQ